MTFPNTDLATDCNLPLLASVSSTEFSEVTPNNCDGSSKTFSKQSGPVVTFWTWASRKTSSD